MSGRASTSDLCARPLDESRRPDEWEGPKGTERTLPVHPLVWQEISEFNRGDSFVLGDQSPNFRHDLVARRFSEWMRSIGWTADRFTKTNHELRRLMGSRWFTKVSPQAAQEWLGHASIETTCKFYAALTEQPAPVEPVGLSV